MPSIIQEIEVDISDFTDNEIYEEAIYRGLQLDAPDLDDDFIREQYNARFGTPIDRDDGMQWVTTYMNSGNYREALYRLETMIPEIRGLSDKIFK